MRGEAWSIHIRLNLGKIILNRIRGMLQGNPGIATGGGLPLPLKFKLW